MALLFDAANLIKRKFNTKYYKNLQEVEFAIKHYMKWFRSMNTHIVDELIEFNVEETTVYRASISSITKDERNSFDVLRIPNWVSTSKNPLVSMGFSDHTFFIIHIPSFCMNAGNISHLSFFPGEEEIIIPPWSVYKLIKMEENAIPNIMVNEKLGDENVRR